MKDSIKLERGYALALGLYAQLLGYKEILERQVIRYITLVIR